MHTTREAAWLCSQCGHMMDAASLSARNNHKTVEPEEGDYTLCINCAACYVRHGTRWQPITVAEVADMHPDNRKQIALHQMAINLTSAGKLANHKGSA